MSRQTSVERLAWRVLPEDAASRGGPVTMAVAAALAPFASELLPDYRVPVPEGVGPAPPPGGHALSALSLPGGGFRVRRGPGTRGAGAEAWDAPDIAGAIVALDMALSEALLHGLEGVRVLHGAGAILGDGADARRERRDRGGDGARDDCVVFPGFGGAGKSTLAAALARHGVPVHGDDVLLVDPRHGTVSAFRRLLKIPEDSRERLGIPRRDTPLNGLWPECAFFRPGDLGGSWAPPARASAVLFPVRAAGARPSFVPVEPPEAVRRLLSQALLVERAGAADFGAAARLLDGAAAAELRYEDAGEAAEFLLSARLPGS